MARSTKKAGPAKKAVQTSKATPGNVAAPTKKAGQVEAAPAHATQSVGVVLPPGLCRVGHATKPDLDAEVAIPPAIAARFPSGKYVRVGRATDGTFFALVEEGQTGPGTGHHQTALYRLYWLDGEDLKRSDAPRILKGDPSFDRDQQVIYLTADNSDVVTFDIETGAFKQLAVRGVVAAGRDTTFGAIHALSGGRVLRCSTGERASTPMRGRSKSAMPCSAGPPSTIHSHGLPA